MLASVYSSLTRKEIDISLTDNIKARVLSIGLPKILRQISWTLYSNNIEDSVPLLANEMGYSWQEIITAMQINSAYYKKLGRVKRKLTKMEECCFQNQNLKMVFLTFTFNNYSLTHNNADSLKQAVRRFLKKYAIKYVANVDYGSRNGRKHFHAVALIDGELNYKLWNYGALNGRKVNLNESASKRMSKYITKLSLHAIKESTQFNRLIYSRA